MSSQYDALVGPGLTFAGIDQGIDFTGKGDVKALAPGVITRYVPSGTGWPRITAGDKNGAVLVERITSGPAKGKYVYTAEDFAASPTLKVGSTVTTGEVIGQALGTGVGIETGWANALGRPVAPLPPPRPAPQFTPEGQSFDNFVQASGGTQGSDTGGSGVLPVTSPAAAKAVSDAAKSATHALTGWVGDLTGWLSDKGKLILAYVLLIGVAGGLFLTGLKGLGVPVPKAVPVPV